MRSPAWRVAALIAIATGLCVTNASSSSSLYPSAQSATCDIAVEVCALEDSPLLTPNDPLFSKQYGPQIIQAPRAWDVTQGLDTVVVAVVDTGIDCTHPDLTAKCTAGFDFVNNVALTGTENSDDYGHGTHVASIAAANTNNGVGVAGLSWASKVMPVKVLNSNGGGNWPELASGIRYAADHGASIINMSLGGSSFDQGVQDAVDYASSVGVLVVSACGNTSAQPCLYPAAYANSMGVSCTTDRDVLCSFSSYGTEVDVAAPGDNVVAAVPMTSCSLCDPSGYRYLSGTSMSTPHVSGVAALVRAVHPEFTASQVWSTLETTADDKGPVGYDIQYGYGRVNAANAVGAPPPPACAPPRHLNPNGKCVGKT